MAHSKELIISSLRQERETLSALIRELEKKNVLTRDDFEMYDEVTKRVEKDIRRLRKIAVTV